MEPKFKRILYGGDYNPNQWPEEIWKEDMRIFRDARINSATINVFSWAKIQPSEHEYHFDELDRIVDMLSEENYDIVMATSTAALPAWMVKRYPEVMHTDYEGRRHKFGGRHNACPNSPVYRHFAASLVERLAEKYAPILNIRMTVVEKSGTVLFDTLEEVDGNKCGREKAEEGVPEERGCRAG